MMSLWEVILHRHEVASSAYQYPSPACAGAVPQAQVHDVVERTLQAAPMPSRTKSARTFAPPTGWSTSLERAFGIRDVEGGEHRSLYRGRDGPARACCAVADHVALRRRINGAGLHARMEQRRRLGGPGSRAENGDDGSIEDRGRPHSARMPDPALWSSRRYSLHRAKKLAGACELDQR